MTHLCSLNYDVVIRRMVGPVLLTGLVGFFGLQTTWADVRWQELNLTPQQSAEMERYEAEWRKVYSEVTPQIHRDTQELKNLMENPNADHGELMMLQSRIQGNKQKLQNEALKTFLKKREKLTPEQRMTLQRMLSN